MKILYLINTKEFNYHKNLVKDFISVIPGDVIDMSVGGPLDTKYYDIEEAKADVIITFDGSGLDLRTVTDTLSLNNLYSRMAHILFHKPSFYGQLLFKRQNLSMFTFVPKGEDIGECYRKYPEVPNIMEFCELYYKTENDDEHKINRSGIRQWWDIFKKEAML